MLILNADSSCQQSKLKRHLNTIHAALQNDTQNMLYQLYILTSCPFLNMNKSMSAHESTTAASLHVSWIRAKDNKPLPDAR